MSKFIDNIRLKIGKTQYIDYLFNDLKLMD